MFATVQEVLTNYRDAVYERDVEKFLLGYAQDVHVFDCWSDWECHGMTAWEKVVTGWLNGVEKEVSLQVEFYDVGSKESENFAYVHTAVAYTAVDPSGKLLQSMKNRFTFVMIRTQDSWEIIHEHSSLPIDSETTLAIFD